MRDEPGASTYVATEEPATLTAAMTATLPAIEPSDAMRGRVCVVTGATRGLGKATAIGLARLGASVVLLGRDERLVAHAAEDVARASGNADVAGIVADLASFDAIRAAASALRARRPAIHVLVHNAGVSLTRRKRSADGIELTLAVNLLAPALLTHELLPALHRGAEERGARIVTVASMFERFGRLALDDLEGERRWYGPLAYAQSKLALLAFTYELATRLAGTGITANAVDPGLVATDLMREHVLFRPRWLRAAWGRVLSTAERGARAAVYAATDPGLASISGECFDRRGRSMRTSRRSRDPVVRARLVEAIERLIGASFDIAPPPRPR
jgi:NAD(P)-dependent dehydrogenase (short-subunit alcohol dehydrogenase family)